MGINELKSDKLSNFDPSTQWTTSSFELTYHLAPLIFSLIDVINFLILSVNEIRISKIPMSYTGQTILALKQIQILSTY